MYRYALAALAVAATASAPQVASATTIFSDNFDTGSVALWSVSSNQAGPGTAGVLANPNAFVSPGFSLMAFFTAPPAGQDLFATATTTFQAPVAADYALSLSASSDICQGCTISYEVYVDGQRLARSTAPQSFQALTFDLPALAAGAHTLGLGVFSDVAFMGTFSASFDDVSVTTAAPVPEPQSVAMLLAGLALVGAAVRKARR